jgi:hypothetical protein
MALARPYSWQTVAPRFLMEYENVLGGAESDLLAARPRTLDRRQAVTHIGQSSGPG